MEHLTGRGGPGVYDVADGVPTNLSNPLKATKKHKKANTHSISCWQETSEVFIVMSFYTQITYPDFHKEKADGKIGLRHLETTNVKLCDEETEKSTLLSIVLGIFTSITLYIMAQRNFYNIPEGEKEIVQTTVSHYK